MQLSGDQCGSSRRSPRSAPHREVRWPSRRRDRTAAMRALS